MKRYASKTIIGAISEIMTSVVKTSMRLLQLFWRLPDHTPSHPNGLEDILRCLRFP